MKSIATSPAPCGNMREFVDCTRTLAMCVLVISVKPVTPAGAAVQQPGAAPSPCGLKR
jgi:hypothetical protein